MCPGTQFSPSLDRVIKSRTDWRESLRASQDSDRPINEYGEIVPRARRQNRYKPDRGSAAVVGRQLSGDAGTGSLAERHRLRGET